MISPRTLSIQFALALLAAGTWWLADSLAPKDEAARKLDSSQVDYYTKNIRRTALAPEGTPKEVLFAELMTHYKDDDRTEMDLPVMRLYKKAGEPWVIKSERGTSLSGGEAVLLHGKVLIARKDSKGEELQIRTSNVKYTPGRDFAETREHVLMLAKDDTTSAEGAEVTFEPVLKIKLLADVRRKHETH